MRLLAFQLADVRGAAAAAAEAEKTAYGFMNGEERCFELQKWKRRASP